MRILQITPDYYLATCWVGTVVITAIAIPEKLAIRIFARVLSRLFSHHGGFADKILRRSPRVIEAKYGRHNKNKAGDSTQDP